MKNEITPCKRGFFVLFYLSMCVLVLHGKHRRTVMPVDSINYEPSNHIRQCARMRNRVVLMLPVLQDAEVAAWYGVWKNNQMEVEV